VWLCPERLQKELLSQVLECHLDSLIVELLIIRTKLIASVVLLLLIILWPVAGNWVINTFRHVDMADGVSAVDHRKDTGSNNFICDWSSDPTCPIRQRVPWLPERMEHEMASRKIDGKTIRYVRTPTRELGAAAVGAIGAVERLRHLGHAEPARRRLAAAEILGAVGGSLPTCTHKKSIGPLP
jgi:hypothetical protein